jgi:hypothetical protein
VEHGLWASYFVLAVVATLLSVSRFGAEVKWLAIFGWGRALFLFVLISTILDRERIFQVLSAAIVINMFVAAAQLFISGAVDVTYALYAKESQTVLAGYLEQGFIPRATGTLGSPVNLGVFALVTFAVACERILCLGYTVRRVAVALSAMITGVLALSKTVVLGIPVVLGVAIVLRLGQTIVRGPRLVPRRMLAFSTVAAAGGVGIWYLVQFLSQAGINILRYIAFLQNPLAALETRYAASEGNLEATMDVAMENWLTGVGFTAPRGEFVGDSTYVLAFHAVGVWGPLIILCLYSLITYRLVVRGRQTMVLPLVALGMTGLALPTLFDRFGAIIISYALIKQADG